MITTWVTDLDPATGRGPERAASTRTWQPEGRSTSCCAEPVELGAGEAVRRRWRRRGRRVTAQHDRPTTTVGQPACRASARRAYGLLTMPVSTAGNAPRRGSRTRSTGARPARSAAGRQRRAASQRAAMSGRQPAADSPGVAHGSGCTGRTGSDRRRARGRPAHVGLTRATTAPGDELAAGVMDQPLEGDQRLGPLRPRCVHAVRLDVEVPVALGKEPGNR